MLDYDDCRLMDGWMDATTYVQNMYVVRGGINGGTKAIIVFDESVQEAKESRTLKARGEKDVLSCLDMDDIIKAT